MISLNKLGSSPSVSVNVKPKVNVNVGNSDMKAGVVSRDVEDVKACYDEQAAEDTIESSQQYKELQNENEVLKLLIDMLRNNPLIYNGYIVADDETLMKFIQLLTSADDVQLDADDIGQGCISKKTYRKVHAIYVITGTETKNLKYDYPKVMKELTDLGISCKFVY